MDRFDDEESQRKMIRDFRNEDKPLCLRETTLDEASEDEVVREQNICKANNTVSMLVVSFLSIIIFLIDSLLAFPNEYGPVTNYLIYDPHRRHEAWRFFTYSFIHVDSLTLILHVIIQLILGLILEMIYKWWRVLLIYTSGVIAGSLMTSILDPTVFAAGSAGGVYALIAAHLATVIINWSEVDYAVIHVITLISIFATDVGNSIYKRLHETSDLNQGYVIHFAGAFAGFLVGIGIFRDLSNKKTEKLLWKIELGAYFGLMAIAILMNIFWTDHFPKSK